MPALLEQAMMRGAPCWRLWGLCRTAVGAAGSTADRSNAQGLDWEFIVVNNDEANAMAVPGGKVVVYSGLLKLLQDEDQLAAVLAHEIAHVVARHSARPVLRRLLPCPSGLRQLSLCARACKGAVRRGPGPIRWSQNQQCACTRPGHVCQVLQPLPLQCAPRSQRCTQAEKISQHSVWSLFLLGTYLFTGIYIPGGLVDIILELPNSRCWSPRSCAWSAPGDARLPAAATSCGRQVEPVQPSLLGPVLLAAAPSCAAAGALSQQPAHHALRPARPAVRC